MTAHNAFLLLVLATGVVLLADQVRCAVADRRGARFDAHTDQAIRLVGDHRGPEDDPAVMAAITDRAHQAGGDQ